MNGKMSVLAIGVLSIFLCMGISGLLVPARAENINSKLAFFNGVLIDGTGANPVKGKCILIKNGKIEDIVETNAMASIPVDYQKMDLKGGTILPGFINAHVHKAYDENQLQTWLASGITTVRDLSARDLKDYLKIRDQLNQNPKNARLVSANPILTKVGGYGWVQINSPAEAEAKTNQFIDDGADIVKIAIEDNMQGGSWKLLTSEEIKAVVKAAHSRNRRVVAHISRVHNLRLGLDSGVDEFAHMLVEPIPDDLMKEIVAKNIYFVPTLELWDRISKGHGLIWNRIAIENLNKFVKAGGKVALGTDFEGYTCSFDKGFPETEVELMQKAGMSPMEIIIAATKNAAYVCGMADSLGTIEKGKIADLIVVNENPLEHLETLYNVQMVIHNGVIAVGRDGASLK